MKFNKTLFRELMKKNSLTSKKLSELFSLKDEKISAAGIDSWTRSAKENIPQLKYLEILGEIFKINPFLLIESKYLQNMNISVEIEYYKIPAKTSIPKSMIKNFNPNYLKIYPILTDNFEPKFCLGDELLIELIGKRKNFKKENGIYLIKENGTENLKYIKFNLKESTAQIHNLNDDKCQICDIKEIVIVAKICDKISNFIGLNFL